MSDLTPTEIQEARWAAHDAGYDDAIFAAARALYIWEGGDPKEWDEEDPHERIDYADTAAVAMAAARPIVEAEVREQTGREIEGRRIPRELLERDHDDQIVAVADWAATVARGYCRECDGTGFDLGGEHAEVEDPDDRETCGACAGYGVRGGDGDE